LNYIEFIKKMNKGNKIKPSNASASPNSGSLNNELNLSEMTNDRSAIFKERSDTEII